MMNPPERLPMGQLLSDRSPFRVPLYQRGYAWQTDELDDFIGDITSMLDDPSAHHFFGGILSVNEAAPETRKGHVFELVDGQQRTTTFTLLIHAVLAGFGAVAVEAEMAGDAPTAQLAARDREVRTADFLTYQEVELPPGTGTFSKNRLQLSRRDDDYFRALLNGDAPKLKRSSPHSHRLLARALEDLTAALVDPITNNEELAPSEKLQRLQNLLTVLTSQCYVIHITTDERDEAYSLFTVLNDRGRSLTDGDLLRTRTLELLEGKAAEQHQAEEAWDQILKGTPNEVRGFLRSYYASHQGKRWPSKDLHKVMWETFFGQEAPVDADTALVVVKRVTDLATENAIYLKLQAGSWPYESSGASGVKAWHQQRLWRLIKVLRGAASIPLLLSVALTRDDVFFAEVVSFLERFTFRYNVVGGHASQLGDRYYAESRNVRLAPDDYSMTQLSETLGAQLARYGSEELFRSSLIERMNYRRSPTPLVKHFLTTLDDYGPWLRGGAKGEPKPETIAAWDLNAIEIEHIYPQRPRVRITELDPLVHELGNLTFWGPDDNKSASNAPFDEKKPKYDASKVPMTKALAALDDWNLEEQTRRRDGLLGDALRLFAFETPEKIRATGLESAIAVWFVQQNPDSRYRDRQGEVYDYPYAIPNAQQIVPGDVLICYQAQRVSDDDRRIFGAGRVGNIVPDGDRLLAVYDRYIAMDPGLTFDDLGGDPRNNRRNAINTIEPAVLGALLRLLGIGDLSEAPAVNPDIDDLVEFGVEEPEEQVTKLDDVG